MDIFYIMMSCVMKFYLSEENMLNTLATLLTLFFQVMPKKIKSNVPSEIVDEIILHISSSYTQI